MLVEGLVLFVLFVFIDFGVFFALGRQVRLSRVFGTHGAERDHFLKILIVTRWTFWSR